MKKIRIIGAAIVAFFIIGLSDSSAQTACGGRGYSTRGNQGGGGNGWSNRGPRFNRGGGGYYQSPSRRRPVVYRRPSCGGNARRPIVIIYR